MSPGRNGWSVKTHRERARARTMKLRDGKSYKGFGFYFPSKQTALGEL